VCLRSKYPWKIWMPRKIFHIKSTLSGFKRHLRELRRIRGS
jgi:hypothetical protein